MLVQKEMLVGRQMQDMIRRPTVVDGVEIIYPI